MGEECRKGHDHKDCQGLLNPTAPSVHQTLDEMDFERGLWYPAMTGDLTRLRYLLDKGRSPDEEDKSGYTALHYAARCGYTAVCAMLLEAGANINATTRAGNSTALQRASLAGHDETMILLLKYGADPSLADADGRTALHRAIEGNHPSTVAKILKAAPQLINVPDAHGLTPVQYAANRPLAADVFRELGFL